MKVAFETITPEQAREMLALSGGNRDIRSARVASLAKDIVAGKYKLNGESIVLDEKGGALDGHNRLEAVVMSGVAIQSVVVRGMTRDVYHTFDSGASRTFADVLKINTEESAKMLASALRYLSLWLCGVPKECGRESRFSNSFLLEVLAKHPSIRTSVEVCEKTKKWPCPLRKSVFATGHYLLAAASTEEAATQFLEAVGIGEMQERNNPAFALRSLLMGDQARRVSRRGEEYLHAFLYAANAWILQRPLSLVRIPSKAPQLYGLPNTLWCGSQKKVAA